MILDLHTLFQNFIHSLISVLATSLITYHIQAANSHSHLIQLFYPPPTSTKILT
jgi:hypothetical protein